VTVHGALKTQLMAGALTLTTFNGTARATKGVKQSSQTNDSFFMRFPPGYDSLCRFSG